MGLKNILSAGLIVLGILLFVVAYLFRIMHWPDMFYGMITGPVLFILGTVFLISNYLRNKS